MGLEPSRELSARVLVIEDEERIAQLVAQGLRTSGWEVAVAEDGERGLRRAAEEAFDVVILDLGLPGVCGREVLREIRRRRGPPVVILTGNDEPKLRRACLLDGAAAFVTKPFSFQELRGLLRAVLDKGEQGFSSKRH